MSPSRWSLEFESFTIKSTSDQKKFKVPDKIDHDFQMHPQHQNTTLVKGTDCTSQNHQKQPKTTTPKKSQKQIKALKRYDFDIVSYALHVAEDIDSFELSTYQEIIS